MVKCHMILFYIVEYDGFVEFTTIVFFLQFWVGCLLEFERLSQKTSDVIMGASSLKKKVKSFRNRGSTPFAINHVEHMWITVVVILNRSKLHDFRQTLDALKRKLPGKSVVGLNGNQQKSPKRDHPSKLLHWGLCLV